MSRNSDDFKTPTRSGFYWVDNSWAVVFTKLRALAWLLGTLMAIATAIAGGVKFANALQKPVVEEWFHEFSAPLIEAHERAARGTVPRGEFDLHRAQHDAHAANVNQTLQEIKGDLRYIRQRVDKLGDRDDRR